MSSAAAAVEKTATKSKVGKKFYQTEGFHSFLLLLPYGLLFFTFITNNYSYWFIIYIL